MTNRKEKRVSVRRPPDEIATILEAVRLLPRDVILLDFPKVFEESVRQDADGRFGNLKTRHQIGPDEEASFWNSFLYEYEWPDPSWFLAKLNRYKRRKFDWFQAATNLQFKGMRKCLNGLPKRFVDYIDLPDKDERAFFETVNRLVPIGTIEDFAAAVQGPGQIQYLMTVLVINSINRYMDACDWHGRIYKMMAYIQKETERSNKSMINLFEEPTFFGIEKVAIVDNRIRFSPDAFTKAFNNSPIDRLRLCDNEKCRKVFWLGRLPRKNSSGKVGCSKECISLLTTRSWRERTTESQRDKYAYNRYKKWEQSRREGKED